MLKYILITILTGFVCLSGCMSSATTDDITMAEKALEHHDYGVALDICQQVSADKDSQLGINDMCRLSLLYMKLSDLKDLEDNAAVATEYYRMAMEACEDSAQAFFDCLPIEDARYVEIMSQLQRILDRTDQPADSIVIPEYAEYE